MPAPIPTGVGQPEQVRPWRPCWLANALLSTLNILMVLDPKEDGRW